MFENHATMSSLWVNSVTALLNAFLHIYVNKTGSGRIHNYLPLEVFVVSDPHAKIHVANTVLPNLSKITETLVFLHKSCKFLLCFIAQLLLSQSFAYKLYGSFQNLVRVEDMKC